MPKELYVREFDSTDDLDKFLVFQSRENGLTFEFNKVTKRAWLVTDEQTAQELKTAEDQAMDSTMFLIRFENGTYGLQVCSDAGFVLYDITGEDCGMVDTDWQRVAGVAVQFEDLEDDQGFWRAREEIETLAKEKGLVLQLDQ